MWAVVRVIVFTAQGREKKRMGQTFSWPALVSAPSRRLKTTWTLLQELLFGVDMTRMGGPEEAKHRTSPRSWLSRIVVLLGFPLLLLLRHSFFQAIKPACFPWSQNVMAFWMGRLRFQPWRPPILPRFACCGLGRYFESPNLQFNKFLTHNKKMFYCSFWPVFQTQVFKDQFDWLEYRHWLKGKSLAFPWICISHSMVI